MRKRWLVAFIILFIYAGFLHAFIGFLIWKPEMVERMRYWLTIDTPEIGAYYDTLVAFHLRADIHLKPNAVLFFGDSQVQGLCTVCITENSANYGIGGDTALGVLKRMPQYPSLNTARAIFIEVGYNDLKYRSIDEIAVLYDELIHQIPQATPIVISAILPIDNHVANFTNISNKTISRLNRHLLDLCDTRERCVYLNSNNKLTDVDGDLRSDLHIGDGVHLNESGYRIWMTDIKHGINSLAYTEK